MQRLLTTVTLAAWFGYGAVSAFTHGVAAFSAVSTGTVSEWLPGFVVDEAVATGFLATSGLFGAGLFLLHVSKGRRAVAAAERLGLVALGLSGVLLLAGTGSAAGPPVSTATLVLVLAVSAMALAIDRLITPDEEEDFDLDTFESGMVAVAEAMARQTRLYTPQHEDRARQ